jgi:ATP-dependent Clp protease adaptor protein ClpS
MKNNTHTITTEDEEIQQAIDELFEHEIILHNDDVNSFEHVIDCLMDYCKHNPLQAEQCALLVHHTGKCSVKKGKIEVLLPIATALLENQLSVTIQ